MMQSESQPVEVAQKVPRIGADAELIDKILQKSEEGKVAWERTRRSYRGRAADGMLTMSLEIGDVPVFGRTWSSFEVTRLGEEILRLENTVSGLSGLAGITGSFAHRKVYELFVFLELSRQREVNAAVSELDRL